MPHKVGMELQDLMLSLLGYCLALLQFFLSMSLSLPFGMVLFDPCYHMLDICNLYIAGRRTRKETDSPVF
jgi:hypothetical protein